MVLDGRALARGCAARGGELRLAEQLCRSQLDRFLAALYRALPEVERTEILWRFHFMMGAMSYAIAGTDALQLLAGKFDDEDPARLAPRLMSFLLGGLRAPLADSGPA